MVLLIVVEVFKGFNIDIVRIHVLGISFGGIIMFVIIIVSLKNILGNWSEVGNVILLVIFGLGEWVDIKFDVLVEGFVIFKIDIMFVGEWIMIFEIELVGISIDVGGLFKVYCDMIIDGGGWMFIVVFSDDG